MDRLRHRTPATAVALISAISLLAGPSSAADVEPERRGPLAMHETVLWQEDFDGQASATGFMHRTPPGWRVDSSGFSTGEQRWAGWAFSTVRDWTWAVGTDRRHWFTGAHNTFAVVESEHQRLAPQDRMTTTLSSPPVSVRGESALALRFDSHYAQGNAPQRAAVSVSFDGGQTRELLALTGDRLSTHEELSVAVPKGARTATFGWSYLQGQNDKWWAIDNVALVRPFSASAAGPLATFDVLSDIHAPRANEAYARAISLFAAQPDKAGALLLNGDIVDVGSSDAYASATAMLRQTPHPSHKVLVGSGNHEFLGPEAFDVFQSRFLALAQRNEPWGEVEVAGIPALSISTEYYSDVDRHGVEPYVVLSKRQLDWLQARLDFHARRGVPVIVMNHHPLPQSVSFTHSAWYGNDFADLEALNGVIAKYSNVIYLSGHTHAWLGLGDWWGRYRVNGSGNPHGFPAVNTGALLNAGEPDGDHDEKRLPGEHATGVRVKVFRDRLRVEGWDVLGGRELRHQDFAVPERFYRAQ